MIPYSLQDMATCDPKGRDCIERNSSESFHCNTTCAGIYADVEWVKKDIEGEISEEESEENKRAELKGKIDDDIMKMFLLLESKMKLMKTDMKNSFEELMKIATGQKGEELDKEKFNMLISEYRKFKTKNVKHFRFNAAANLCEFGESCLSNDKYE